MRKILSVDDDPQVLRCFQDALKRKGYEVFVTSDPSEAATIIKEHDLDLVMLDIRMPKISGFQVFKELKKKYSSLPVLFVTAYPKSFSMDSEDVVEMWKTDFADGNTDILYKPFEVEALYRKVEGLIGRADEGQP